MPARRVTILRALRIVGILDRIAPRRTESGPHVLATVADDAPIFSTKALRKFLTSLALNENRELGRLTERQRNVLASELEAKAVRRR